MARRSSGPVFSSTPAEAEVAQYRPFCGLAVVALVVGLLSVAALFDTMFWFLPVLGIVLSAVALRRIARSDPPLVGRFAALGGLGLSLALAVAAPTDFFYYRWQVRQEAREFGFLFLKYLADGAPEKAAQLYDSPSARQPLEGDVWSYYPAESENRATLEGVVAQRAIKALLLLGKGAAVRCDDAPPAIVITNPTLGMEAVVRYYDTEKQWTAQERDYVAQSFAVTLVEKGEKQTFFVRLRLERSQVASQRRGFWRVHQVEGGITPVALGGPPPQI